MTAQVLYRYLVLGFTCAVAITAQVGPDGASASNGHPAAQRRQDVMIHVMDFKLDSLITGVKASLALTIPFQCASSGAVLVNMVDPLSGDSKGSSTLLVLKENRGIPVNISSVRDIDIESVNSYFFSGADAVLSVYGRRKVDSTTDKSPQSNFLALFGTSGEYKRFTEIKNDQLIGNIAVLPSGDLLMSGHNIVDRQDTLAIYDASGIMDRPLDQPMTAKERETGYQQGNPTTFINHGDSVVAYRQGTRNAILEIGQKNTVKEIPLALPPGAVISEMVSSDDSFIVHSYPDHDPGTAFDTASGVYYEFNPFDGSLIRILKSGSTLVSTIACKSGGQFTAFVTNKDHQFMKMSAN